MLLHNFTELTIDNSQKACIEVADFHQANRRWGIRLPTPILKWTVGKPPMRFRSVSDSSCRHATFLTLSCH